MGDTVDVELRDLEARDIAAAGELLHAAFSDAGMRYGQRAPWGDARAASDLVAANLARDGGGAVVADVGGAVVGVGFVRRRGDVASVGPIATRPSGRGVGGLLLDELVARADGWGCAAVRLFQDAWNPDSFALYAGRSFAAVDVVACLERMPQKAPRIDSARGLEVAAFKGADLAEAAALDLRLTGLTRPDDLASNLKLVARRRGVMVGFAGSHHAALGPVMALDVADLGALMARMLVDAQGGLVARLSTAAPTAMLAAMALGFRVVSLGTLMVRGPAPPARPPQLYALWPEIL